MRGIKGRRKTGGGGERGGKEIEDEIVEGRLKDRVREDFDGI